MMGIRRSDRRYRRTVRAAAAVAAMGGLLAAAVPALSGSSSVSGKLDAQDASGPDCTSPVGVCSRGTLSGGLKGTFTWTATALVANSESPSTSVIWHAADMVITTKDGELTCKDAGALATTPEHSVASVCTVIGGSGAFAGATGRLRLSGTSALGSGQQVYEGRLTTP